jgi:hypothetical protein
MQSTDMSAAMPASLAGLGGLGAGAAGFSVPFLVSPVDLLTSSMELLSDVSLKNFIRAPYVQFLARSDTYVIDFKVYY